MDTRDRAAVIQINSGDEISANLKRAETLIAGAVADNAALAVLPENFAIMGRSETDKLRVAEQDGDGPIQSWLAETARRHDIWLIAGTVPVLADESHVFGACLVYSSAGERVARYDKIHLFDVDVPGGTRYRESSSIARGATLPVCVDTPVGRIGLSVCYDLRFPELYRQLSSEGAEILCVPSAFTVPTGRAHWQVLLRARAIENQCYVLAAAQVGRHADGRDTYGHSMIIDPWGDVAAACGGEEGWVGVSLSAEHLREVRRSFPSLQHRRLSH